MKAVVGITFGILFCAQVFAAADSLKVEGAYAYYPLKDSHLTAAYAKFINSSLDNLTIKVTGAEGFQAAELHETIEKNGLTKMHHLKEVVLGPKETKSFQPGALHIMLFLPTDALKGKKEIILTFSVNKKEKKIPFLLKNRNE